MHDLANDKDLTGMTDQEIVEYLLKTDKVLIAGECKSFTHSDSIEDVEGNK